MPVLANIQHTLTFYLTLPCTRSAHLTEPSQLFLSVPGLRLLPSAAGQWESGEQKPRAPLIRRAATQTER